jgi:hypothetical protein
MPNDESEGIVRHAMLEEDRVYRLRGSAAEYRCLWRSELGDYALVQRVSESAPWRMYVHDITLYPDGSITWAYSSGGRFEP